MFFKKKKTLTKQDWKKLNQFAKAIKSLKRHFLGYPLNLDVHLKPFYKWMLKTGLTQVGFNNIGDPFIKDSLIHFPHAHEFEKEIIQYFAPLYGFDEKNCWGIVTANGTDGNNHGIYFGRKFLQGKSKKQPIIYVSEEAHYSVKKLADVQNTELCLVKTNPMGQMDLKDLEQKINPKRPVLIVVAFGTTAKGALDDIQGINALLKRKKVKEKYIHIDAAMSGSLFIFGDKQHQQLINKKTQSYDSIAVSGHKFYGTDDPVGYFITTQEIRDKINPFYVDYLAIAPPTISCSRNGLSVLKFWYVIHKKETKGYQQDVKRIFEKTETIFKALKEMGIPVWKHEHSNIVFFKRPADWIMEKYTLAPFLDRGKKKAHLVLEPHVSNKIVEEFIKDMKKSLKD